MGLKYSNVFECSHYVGKIYIVDMLFTVAQSHPLPI